MPIAHVDVAIRCRGRVRRPIERVARRGRGVQVRAAQGQDVPAVLRPLPDGVVAAVGGVDEAIDAHADPVREGEGVGAHRTHLAPGIEEPPVAVEDHHRVGAPREHVDVVIEVDGDVGDIDERPALRTPEEAVDHFVSVASDVDVHGVLRAPGAHGGA